MNEKKENRRIEIALQAYDMHVEKGIDGFSLNGLLQSIPMSKGNFYHYFKNQDDLYYQVIKVIFGSFLERFVEPQKPQTFEDKLHKLFFIYLSELQEVKDYMVFIYEIYPFFSNAKNQFTYNFMQEYYIYLFTELEKVMKEEIEKGNLKDDILTMIKPIAATADGIFTHSCMLKDYNRQEEMKIYLKFISEHYKK